MGHWVHEIWASTLWQNVLAGLLVISLQSLGIGGVAVAFLKYTGRVSWERRQTVIGWAFLATAIFLSLQAIRFNTVVYQQSAMRPLQDSINQLSKRLDSRELTVSQAATLKQVLGAGPDLSDNILILAFASCFDCPRYGWGLAETINQIPQWANHKVGVGYAAPGIDVHWHDLVIVADQHSANAQVFAAALTAAHISFSWGLGYTPGSSLVALVVMPPS